MSKFGDYAAVSQQSGVPLGTLQKMMTGATDPRFSNILDVCRTIGVSLDYIVTGIDPEADSGDWETPLGPAPIGEKRVPMYEVAASAGHGARVFGEAPAGWWTFPLDWLMRLGSPEELNIIKVEGDSMLPELRDGDHVMIDLAQTTPRDGLFVIDVDEMLFLKRIRVLGRNRVELVSSNAAYPPFEVTIPGADDDVAQDGATIMGRVVWIGRVP